eukprot:scaffold4297_cov103-Isochrysis_galbana.AAC.2
MTDPVWAGHVDRVHVLPPEVGDRRDESHGVVLHEAVHQVPDGVVGAPRLPELGPLGRAEGAEEPLTRAPGGQALSTGGIGRVRACPERLELGSLLVPEPPADARAMGGHLVVERPRHLARVGCPA